MFRSKSIISCIMLLFLIGCSYTKSVPISWWRQKGFTYPICYPFLIVSGAKAELVMVPNPKNLRGVRFGAFLAKNNVNIKFDRCGPVDVQSDMDSTTVLVSLFNNLSNIVKSTAPGGLYGVASSSGNTGPSFQVFEFIFDDFGNFIELRPHIRPGDFVHVTIGSPAKTQSVKKQTTPKPNKDKPKSPTEEG